MHPSPHQETSLPIVLIVDDQPDIRQIVTWSLRAGGFHPVEAANGVEAVTWMEQCPHEQRYPALILLDLLMPQMDGSAFLRWLQSNWSRHYPTPAIILFSANAIGEEILALSPAIKHIIRKPFHTGDLLALVRHWSAEGRSWE